MKANINIRHNNKIIITSKYGGVDYTATKGAYLSFLGNYFCGGDTVFEHLKIASTTGYSSIWGQNYKLVMGEGIVCVKIDGASTYMSVMGGSNVSYSNASSNLTINSGTWQRVRGGTAANGSENYTVDLTVNGGNFVESLILGSSDSHSGDIKASINGGNFYGGIYASGINNSSHTFDSKITLTLNGGVYYGVIGVVQSGVGSFSGNFEVIVKDGEYAHLNRIEGTSALLGSMTSKLTSKIDLDKKESGSYNFSNPVRSDGPDPWLFFHNGYYYFISTTGSTLKLKRARNIGDLPYAEQKIIYDPEDGQMWSKNLWSPEIHYYTDEQIGKGNGGWYCYIACDNGQNIYHRMYVIKCLDGDDLFGRWGNPLTGEVNVPAKITANDIEGFDDTWAAGLTDIIINDQPYLMYVTETGRGTSNFYQTINMVKLTNPWTIEGKSYVICKSEYSWEMGGADGKRPKVVEGGTAVYGDNGEIFIIYSGSGYWTTLYSLGQLTYLGGDPLDINNWQKLPTPIFSKSSQINGCGHASYVTDTSGQRWICYHAYIGTDTSSGRYAFVEPYSVDSSGVTISDGKKTPADMSTVYTSELNPLALRKKICFFDSVKES